MTLATLRYKGKIPKKQAADKIMLYASFSKIGMPLKLKTRKQVVAFYAAQGIQFESVVELCRNPQNQVPHFENLITSTWNAHPGDGQIALVDDNLNEQVQVQGAGVIEFSSYEAHFRAACKARDRAVSEGAVEGLMECLSPGFASIESFLSWRASLWNETRPNDTLQDSRETKVSLEDKIKDWIPKITGGREIPRDGQLWMDFKYLKGLRDNFVIHPKKHAYAFSYKEIARSLNSFRSGLADLLGRTHCLMGIPVPSIVINAVTWPDVEVDDSADNNNV
jgi:hypothetical protein